MQIKVSGRAKTAHRTIFRKLYAKTINSEDKAEASKIKDAN